MNPPRPKQARAALLVMVSMLLALPQARAQNPPRAHQIDLELDNIFGFVAASSIVRVREFNIEGTGLHLAPDLGINTVQIPDIKVRYWFDSLNAVELQFRNFDAEGTHPLPQPATYNGTTIAGGQRIHSRGDPWFALGGYYQRRFPSLLRGVDLRADLGLEYTYINFAIVNPTLASNTAGHETKEDFLHQELPMPTIGLEARRPLNEQFTLEGTVKGNWISHWNSFRPEGGTVWLTQAGFETHLRVIYADRDWFRYLHPVFGIAYYYYRQLEQSREDGNLIKLSAWGPELGLNVSF